MNVMTEWLKRLKSTYLLFFILIGCGNATVTTPAPTPTNTPIHTTTPLPTNTPSPTETRTRRPTSTPYAFPSTPDVEATVVHRIETGESLQGRREYMLAIAELNRIIERDPDNADTYSIRGVVYHYLAAFGEMASGYELAIADQTKAIELEPYLNGWYHYLRGWSYVQIEQHEKANADFVEADRLGIGLFRTAPYHLETGRVLGAYSDLNTAIVEYSRAIELDPNNPEGYNGRATMYNNLAAFGGVGNEYEYPLYPLAIADQAKAIELAPYPNPSYYYWRGRYYQRDDQNEKACADFAEAGQLGHREAREQFEKAGCGRELKPSPTPTPALPSIPNSNDTLPMP